MEDVIRKAVELADGFWWKEDCVHVLDTPMHYRADALPQTILDALAAQLTRQVDELDDYWVCAEDDRTMNTIKAIVDSKVLE